MTTETATPHRATSSELERLRDCVHGPVIGPDENGYDKARSIWNGAIDRRPAGIVRCTGIADVAAAVRYARERDLLVAVRSGGHGVGGHALCDGGLVIDLSPMRGIRVDPAARTARAEAGVLWGEFDRETQLFGLATVGGIVTHTGIAGLTLGGGIGWLMRKYGATVDNLLSVDVVTADGELVTASEDHNPDLFWGVRGAGGNFGIVTSFEYRLHPVGPIVLAGPIFHRLQDAPEVLRFYREFAATAPDELTTIFELELAPLLPFLPEDVHGKPIVMVGACYAGPPEDGAEVVRPLKEFGNPISDLLEPKPYLALQSMFDPFVPHGWHRYWKSVELPPLTDNAIDMLIDHTSRITSPRSYTIIFQLGGALARVAEDATAYPQRDAAFNVNINAVWTEDDPDAHRHIAWARDFFDAMQPHARDRVYVNFLGDEGPDRVRQAYGTEKYDRLVELKRNYDPTNFFRHNQNIPPK
jgi:FAD/FMN-containing dehydrogenase